MMVWPRTAAAVAFLLVQQLVGLHASASHQQHILAQELAPAPQDQHQHGHLPRPRVAIVGGGAGGTSSAYFLAFLASQDPRLSVDVDLFEANDYIGGRSTILHLFNDDKYSAVEVGASIFVQANKNLWKAANVFNLTLQDMHGGDEEDAQGMAIWDGEDFVYKESSGYGWWNMAKLFWRYGYSPLTVKNTVTETVAKFTELYSPSFQKDGPYETVEAFATGLNLQTLAHNTTKEYLKSLNVNELFIRELVAAATRVNYGQNPGKLQAFEGMVSMAASGASSIKGGNRQIFEHFLANSNAKVHLGARVKSIERLRKTSSDEIDSSTPSDPTERPWLVRYEDTETGRSSLQTYDAIIYSSPLHPQTPSTVQPPAFVNSDIPTRVPVVPYVHLHVTLLVTNASNPRAEFFGKHGGEIVSTTVLSTFEPFDTGKSKTRPRLNSLNYLRNLGNLSAEIGVGHVIKIFSEYSLTEDILQEAFGPSEVLWVHRKEWPAYPISPPFGIDEEFASFKPDPSVPFYYVNAFERWVSTMETETVSAWNAVSLLTRDLFGYSPKKSWASWDE